MTPLVTTDIPVYKRLEYLPLSLASVQVQDYPHIECLVSDNGLNGTKVEEVVGRHYTRPFLVRHNLVTVGQSEHYNQIARESSGTYFVLLNDDDDIGPNFVSELMRLLEGYPQASVAVPNQEIMDLSGGRSAARPMWFPSYYRERNSSAHGVRAPIVSKCSPPYSPERMR